MKTHTSYNARLDGLYFGGDIEILRAAAGSLPDEFVLSAGNNSKKLITEIVSENKEISKTLFNNYSKSLQKAVNSVFGKTDYLTRHCVFILTRYQNN
jgi:hypothetical protein